MTAFIFSGALTALTFNSETVESYVFKYINEERSQRGLPTLGNDTQLSNISKYWSDSLLESKSLSHGNFENRIQSIGYLNYRCGEIIANTTTSMFFTLNSEQYSNPASVVAKTLIDGWLNSPAHKEIMLTNSNGEMGVAVTRSGLGIYYSVVDFKFQD